MVNTGNVMNRETSAGNPLIEKSYVQEIYQNNTPLYVGDAVEITPYQASEIKVTISNPYSDIKDEFQGKFSLTEQSERFAHWTQNFTPEVIDFIADNIENQSRDNSIENAKIGFASYAYDNAAIDVSPALAIRPINHLLTVAFNRKLALDRLKSDIFSKAHQIWYSCFSDAIQPLQNIKFSCPSQLFIELGLITSDHFIPITIKSNRTSVYAMRNKGQPLKTCGLESGLNWKDVVSEPNDNQITEIDLLSGTIAGLKRKFPMPDWEARKAQINLVLKSIVVQTLHMNTAILGYCFIPYSSKDLQAHLKGKIYGGLDHSELDFIRVENCEEMVEKHHASTEWHGTAIMRLKLISENKKLIEKSRRS